jgi:hypothetical protein
VVVGEPVLDGQMVEPQPALRLRGDWRQHGQACHRAEPG